MGITYKLMTGIKLGIGIYIALELLDLIKNAI